MARVVLLTGGNLGDVSGNMIRVVALISSRIGEIEAKSKIYESDAWGFESSDTFQNQALVIDTEFGLHEVLFATQSIEMEFGKEVGAVEFNEDGDRVYRSREMDIDIMFYDDIVFNSETLTIPHSKLHLRSFVLNPLSEVVGEFIHPKLGISINNIKEQYERDNL